jgi:hypothetical protein
MKTGRYTGTAVLERGDEHELGLVPLIRVRSSTRPGYLGLHPTSRRSLKYSRGGSFFPVGVRLGAEDLQAPDWKTRFQRLRANGVNYFDIPVEAPETQTSAERLALERAVDNLLVQAEQADHVAVQLRFPATESVSGDGAAAYEEQLQRWVRRWSYSPALAVWHVVGAGDSVDADAAARFVQAVRRADTYDHLVAVPSASGRVRGGADLPVMPFQPQRPTNRFALLEMPEAGGTALLPGESSWQMLAVGGIGLPIYPYPGGDDTAFLQRMSRLSRAARAIPFHGAGSAMSLAPVDTPASFGRYGSTTVGWIAPDAERTLKVPAVPRGRYRAQFWDPSSNSPVAQELVWSDGGAVELQLPKNLQAVFFQLSPTTGGAVAAKPPTKPAVRTVKVRKAPVRTVARRPVKRTAAQLRAEKRAAAKRAAANRRLAMARKKPVKKTRSQLRAEKRAAARLAAQKKSRKNSPAQLRAAKRAAAKKAASAKRKKSTAKKPARVKKTSKAKKPAPTKTKKPAVRTKRRVRR